MRRQPGLPSTLSISHASKPLLTPFRWTCSFKDIKTYSPVHTGGKATLSGDGGWLVSTLNEQALVTDVETGEQIQELKGVSATRTLYRTLADPLVPIAGHLGRHDPRRYALTALSARRRLPPHLLSLARHPHLHFTISRAPSAHPSRP